MVKSSVSKTNGNIFKTIVKEVIEEEVPKIVQKEMKSFKQEMHGEMKSFKQEMHGEMKSFKQEMHEEFSSFKEETKEQMETQYANYRDVVLTKLDAAIGTLRKTDQEQMIHAGQHENVNDRLEGLESLHPKGKHTQ